MAKKEELEQQLADYQEVVEYYDQGHAYQDLTDSLNQEFNQYAHQKVQDLQAALTQLSVDYNQDALTQEHQ